MSDKPNQWEEIAWRTWRLSIPEGHLYRFDNLAMVLVPYHMASGMDPAHAWYHLGRMEEKYGDAA